MTELRTTILVIEDEPQMRRFLRALIGNHGYALIEAETGREALALAASHRPDLIVLDLGLPDVEGLELVASLRSWTQTPIIVVSARGQEQDKVRALDLGADDYLTKPFGSHELLARIRVALRHRGSALQPALRHVERDGLVVDLDSRRVTRDGDAVHLTPTEFALLARLVRGAGRIVTHRQLLADVWGAEHVDDTHYLRLYMGQLRSKLERTPSEPRFLLTEIGVGYRFAVD